ncbi:hypothetical protein E4U41_003583 [Claviceps citrina]|nr:hypothetical protein E4U41_003583 [Claviceps citrina]
MGFVEAIVEHFSAKTIFSLLLLALILCGIVTRFKENWCLERLINRGIDVSSWIPLAFIICKSIFAVKSNGTVQLWQDLFVTRRTCITVEARFANEHVVFTVDPDNMKAILATQFSDYGKGESFHAEWNEFLGAASSPPTTPRQMLRPLFTKDRVGELECFELHMKTLFRAIANRGAMQGENRPVDMSRVNGQVLDVADLLYRFTLDVATDFLLGADVKPLRQQEFAEAFNAVQRFHNISSRANWFRNLIARSKYRSELLVINTLSAALST